MLFNCSRKTFKRCFFGKEESNISPKTKRSRFFPMRFRLLQHVKLENFYSQMNKAFKRGASYPNYFLTSGFSQVKNVCAEEIFKKAMPKSKSELERFECFCNQVCESYHCYVKTDNSFYVLFK
ncbi:hypothetical protein CDAR_256001 [Caerostris darwini]|uniref:LAGLIDADG homing endonuclease n=1 Tax=Caerostris darwini TaxID=1538125 RepID=A0AAV4PU38_9ARAC|nr:hypothetical protein CDAR_256001 [Caerostris darwini]